MLIDQSQSTLQKVTYILQFTLCLTFLLIFLQDGEKKQVCPVIMCTRTSPGPVPEFQLFLGDVGEPEVGVAEQGRERESDRDSAAESSQGSDTSEGPARLGEKEDALGDLFFPGEK